MNNFDLARIKTDEALKIGLESQRIHRELSASKSTHRESKQAFLHTQILAVKGYILQFGEKLYCRTLGFIYSRPA
jgi:hypothetical protein